MSGWEKVVAATALALIGLLGLNLAIWRRVRAAVRPGAGEDASHPDPAIPRTGSGEEPDPRRSSGQR